LQQGRQCQAFGYNRTAALFSVKCSFTSKITPQTSPQCLFHRANCKSKSGSQMLKASSHGPAGSLALWGAARARRLAPQPQQVGAGGVCSLWQHAEERDSISRDRKSELKCDLMCLRHRCRAPAVSCRTERCRVPA